MGDHNNTVNLVSTAYKPVVTKFHDQLLNTYTMLTKQVTDQNDTIDAQIKRYAEEASPNYQKSVYEFSSAENLSTVFWNLVNIFLLLMVVLGVVMYFNNTNTPMMKVIIYLKVVSFPIWFYIFQQLLYLVYTYIYSFATSRLYTDVYLNQY